MHEVTRSRTGKMSNTAEICNTKKANYLAYYDLERYLFEEVNQRFHQNHYLSAFDFFSIVIWKANRAKSRIARKLLAKDPKQRKDLEAIVRTLTGALYEAADHKERLRISIKDWGFALPMASAILTVCWPDDFTVYDYRVRERLTDFPELKNLTDFDKIWTGYQKYKDAVEGSVDLQLNLRDKDRYLWGESAAMQLKDDILRLFVKADSETEIQ